MNAKSIRTHLAPYKILSKRKTTIAHAFASALAPVDEFNEEALALALAALGQTDRQSLSCVYCGRPAQTWDHLVNLVKDGNLNGYGHQLGNLVPSCRDCNSAKGSAHFATYVHRLAHLDESEQEDLIWRLNQHLGLAHPVDPRDLDAEQQKAFEHFESLKKKIFELMREADTCAAQIRRR